MYIYYREVVIYIQNAKYHNSQRLFSWSTLLSL